MAVERQSSKILGVFEKPDQSRKILEDMECLGRLFVRKILKDVWFLMAWNALHPPGAAKPMILTF